MWQAAANRAASELLTRLGHPEIRPSAEVGSLSAASQQMVSIARALSQDAKLIVMDEPSAVLDSEEVANLFRVVRSLTARGVAVLYISHRLEEIRQIGDRITVLKDGFEWQGSPYKSISALARAITGTQWNGWVFFGLKNHRSRA